MLTPMLVQYLVGLCCLRRNASAVEVVVGDLVPDEAAKKSRDVDITVTLAEADGTISAFKAFEVKKEGDPLDVADVEQLCLKLLDMSSVTHRAIVSASGFTPAAVAKAERHGIVLYQMKPWTRPVREQFPAFESMGSAAESFVFEKSLLIWAERHFYLVVSGGPPSFNVDDASAVFDAEGKPHARLRSVRDLQNELMMRSTTLLLHLDPAQSVRRTFLAERMADRAQLLRPPWPHTHTLETKGDQVYLRLGDALAQIDSVTISGFLQWQTTEQKPEYHLLERVPRGEVFAAAAIAEGLSEGSMVAIILSPESRTTHIHQFALEERHRNMIRKLRIPPVQTTKPN